MPILYVSHSVAEVARLATTVVILTEGKVTAVGPVADILPQADSGDGGSVLDAKVARHDEAFQLSVLTSHGRRAAGAAAQRARSAAPVRAYIRGPRCHAVAQAAPGDQRAERAGRPRRRDRARRQRRAGRGRLDCNGGDARPRG